MLCRQARVQCNHFWSSGVTDRFIKTVTKRIYQAFWGYSPLGYPDFNGFGKTSAKSGERLTKIRSGVKLHAQAEVAELADALRSGRSEHTLMWVQVPPSAQANTWIPPAFTCGRAFYYREYAIQ